MPTCNVHVLTLTLDGTALIISVIGTHTLTLFRLLKRISNLAASPALLSSGGESEDSLTGEHSPFVRLPPQRLR